MPSSSDRHFSLPVLALAPLAILPSRKLRVSFPRPSPLLCALGAGEQPGVGLWSDWLAQWGWTWAVCAKACEPSDTLIKFWLQHKQWPQNFHPRVLSLAVALRLRVDGQALSESDNNPDFERVWRVITQLSQQELSDVLALALLRANTSIFNFASVAPDWPSDVGRVLSERFTLRDRRQPSPIWLRWGYSLLGEDVFGYLRAIGTHLQDCQDIWDAYATSNNPPLSFEMAFWWEATYCLTERHNYEDAEKAQEKVSILARKLETMTGLIDPLWHHQQGRLFYYAGKYEWALQEFLREDQSHGQDLKVTAMLQREIANVLSDLACLQAAQVFAENSITMARQQCQQAELYKSLGRLAEILIKRGDFEGAEKHLTESLAIQKQIGDENRSPVQTLVYLGHVAILQGNLKQAAMWYDSSAEKGDDASLPYITMGRFALAAATGNRTELEQLWQFNQQRIEQWQQHQTLVLPASVCTLAAAQYHKIAKEKLPMMVQSLIDHFYVVEAAYVFTNLPEADRPLYVQGIMTVLNGWKKNLKSLPPTFTNITGPLNGPTQLVEEIRTLDLRTNVMLRTVAYPMTLVKL